MKTISELVFLELNRRREKAEYVFNHNKQILFDNEEVSAIKREINKISRLIGKSEFDNLDCTTLKKELINLQGKLKTKLDELGFDENSKPNYTCQFCKDTGFANNKICKCFIEIYNEIAFEELGINKKHLVSFDKDTKSFNTNLKDTYEFFKNYCQNFNVNSNSYVFLGKCGTGKTFLTQCITSELQENFNVLYLTSFELNNLFLKYHTCPLEEKRFFLDSLTTPDLLIIDDLGTEPIYNKVTLEYLFMLLNERKNPFIITTNLTLKELFNRYGERIFSRLIQSEKTKVLEFDIENLRQ